MRHISFVKKAFKYVACTMFSLCNFLFSQNYSFITQIEKIDYAVNHINNIFENSANYKELTLNSGLLEIEDFIGIQNGVVVSNAGSLHQILNNLSNCVQNISNEIDTYNIGTDILNEENFNNFMTELSSTIFELANHLLDGYQKFFLNNDNNEILSDPEYVMSSFDESVSAINSINQNILGIPQLCRTIFENIVNMKNYQLNDDFVILSQIINSLKNSFDELGNSLNSKNLFDQYFVGLNDSMIDFSVTSKNILEEISFEISHEIIAMEFIDHVSEIESYTSSTASLLQKMSARDILTIYNKSSSIVLLDGISNNIDLIKNNLNGIINLIKQEDDCLFSIDFLNCIRPIKNSVIDGYNKLNSLYFAVFNEESGIIVPQHNLDYMIDDYDLVFQKINLDVQSTLTPLNTIFEKFGAIYDYDIGLSISNLLNKINLLNEKIFSENSDSIVSELTKDSKEFCIHHNVDLISLLTELHSHIDNMPIFNTDLCCHVIFDELKVIHDLCFKIFRFFNAISLFEDSYSWDNIDKWIQLFDSMNTFFSNSILSNNINETLEEETCNADKFENYLILVKDEIQNLCNDFESIVNEINIPNFVPDFTTNYGDKGCASISILLDGIKNAFSKIINIITTVKNNFINSGYIYNNLLTESISETVLSISNFFNALDSNAPLPTEFCPTCLSESDVSIELIKNDLSLDFVNNLDDLKQILEISYCCKKPAEYLFEINKFLTGVGSILELVGDEIFSNDLRDYNFDSLNLEMNRFSEILDEIDSQIILMNNIVSTYNSSTMHPCIFQNFSNNLLKISIQIENIYQIALNVAKIFDVNLENINFNFTYSANSCSDLSSLFVILYDRLSKVSEFFDELNTNINSKLIVPYEISLKDSFENSLQKFLVLKNNISSLCDQIETNSSLYRCEEHCEYDSLKTSITNVYNSYNDLVDTVKNNCCSEFSLEILKFTNNLNNSSLILEGLFSNYSVDIFSYNENMLQFYELSNQLTNTLNISNDLIQEISLIPNTTPQNHCTLSNLNKNLSLFNEYFGEINIKLSQILLNYGINVNISNIENYIKQDCNNVLLNCESLINSSVSFKNNLLNFGNLIRENPPLYSNFFELIDSFQKLKLFTENMYSVIEFLEESYFLIGGTLYCENCERSSNPYQNSISEQSKILSLQEFDNIINTISHDGCCTYFADEFMDCTNSLREVSYLTASISLLENLTINDEENFCNYVNGLVTLYNENKPFEALANSILNSLVEDCIYHDVTNEMHNVKIFLQNSIPYISNIATTLGANFDIGSVTKFQKDRSITGCNSIKIYLEDIKNTLSNIKTNLEIIIQNILNERSRDYQKNVIDALKSFYTFFAEIFSNIEAIKNEHIDKVFCQACTNIGNTSQNNILIGNIFENLSEIKKLIGDDSDESIIGILERYCNSNSNLLLYEISNDLFYIKQCIEDVSNYDEVFSYTFDSSIYQKLFPLEASFLSLKSNLSIYADSFVDGAEVCGLFENNNLLQIIVQNIDEIKNNIISLLEFIGINNFSNYTSLDPLLTGFNVTNDVIDEIIDSLNKINNRMTTIVSKMQNKNVHFAKNPNVLEFINNINSLNILSEIKKICNKNPCNYVDFEKIDRSFSLTLNNISNTLNEFGLSFSDPNCCYETREIFKDISKRSNNISVVCDLLLKEDTIADSMSDHFVTIIQNFAYCLNNLKNSGVGFIQKFNTVNKNKSCVLLNFEDCSLNLLNNSVIPLENFIYGLANFLNINWQEHIVLNNFEADSSCEEYSNYLIIFKDSIQKINDLVAFLASKILNKEIINFSNDLIDEFSNLVTISDSIRSTFSVLSSEFKLINECYGCYENDYLISDCFFDISYIVNELYENIYSMYKYVDKKCCSIIFQKIYELAESSNKIKTFLSKILINNTNFIKTFFYENGFYKFIENLANNDENYKILENLKNKIINLSNSMSLNVLTDGQTCNSRNLYNEINDIILIHKKAADILEEFYNDYCFNGVINYEPINVEIDYSCESEIINNILENYYEIGSIINDFSNLSEIYTTPYGSINFINEVKNSFVNLNNSITTIFNINGNICNKCVDYKNIFINISNIISNIVDDLNKFYSETMFFECCSGFVSSIVNLNYKIETFSNYNNVFLTNIISELLERSQNDILSNQQIKEISIIFNEYIEFLKNIDTNLSGLAPSINAINVDDLNDYCNSEILIPYVVAVSYEFEKFSKFLNNKIIDRYKITYEPKNSDSLSGIALSCDDITPIGTEISKNYNVIIESWKSFGESFVDLDIIRYDIDFYDSINYLSQYVSNIRNHINSFSNSILRKNNNDLYVLCSSCTEIDDFCQELINCKTADYSENIFQSMKDFMDENCCEFRARTIFKIEKDISYIINNFSEILNNENFESTFSNQNFKTYYSDFANGIGEVVSLINNLSNVSIDPNLHCNSVHTDLLLNDIEKAICNVALSSSGMRNYDFSYDEITGPTYDIPENLNCDSITDIKLLIQQNFVSFLNVWTIFCEQIDKFANIDSRLEISKIMDNFYKNLLLLSQKIYLFEIFDSNEFCENCNEITPIIQPIFESIENILFITNPYIKSLSYNNCCDKKADCIYTVSKLINQMTSFLPENTINLNQLILNFTNMFNNFAVLLNKISKKSSEIFLKNEDSSCHVNEIDEEFTDIINTAETYTNNFFDIINLEKPSIIPWDEISIGSLNDCGYIPNLYCELLFNIEKFMPKINSLCCADNKQLKDFFEINQLVLSIKGLSNSIENLIDVMYENYLNGKNICDSCQNSKIITFLKRIQECIESYCDELDSISKNEFLNKIEETKHFGNEIIIDLFDYEKLIPINISNVKIRDDIELFNSTLNETFDVATKTINAFSL